MKMELKYRETLLATSEKYINLAGSILDRTIALNKKFIILGNIQENLKYARIKNIRGILKW